MCIRDRTKREQPDLSCGRVLLEAFDEDIEAPKVAQSIKRLNQVLIEAHGLSEARKKLLADKGFMTLDELGKWHTTQAGSDFEKFTLQQEAIFQSQD